jgi:hypothetical protein
MPSKPYEDRTDIEKIQSQWNKLSGLHSREEWSAAVVRAATAAEIAANLAVRKEFAGQSKLSDNFVNSLLRWANGIDGKLNRLLLPISEGKKANKLFKKVKNDAERVNKKRNAIAHQGEFCNAGEAEEAISSAKIFIESVVRIYHPKFKLEDHKK